jgi:peroxiredoxin family protein
VTRGTSNNLFQVATLVRAATALDVTVDVLFSDAALARLHRDRINEPAWSRVYAAVLPGLQERLRDAEFVNMDRFLQDAKEHGDAVRYWACSETLEEQRLALGDLTMLLDGERSLAQFLEEAQRADALLTF